MPEDYFSWAGEQEVLAFCLGAFQDALCLRQNGSQRANNLGASESPELCILCLAVLLTICLAAALLLPGVRAVQALSTPEFAPGLVLIYDAGANNDEPTISSGQYRAWKRLRQRYFDGFAFYKVTQEAVGREPDSNTSHAQARWQIGRATPNLFRLMRTQVRFQSPAERTESNMPEIILSEALWKREFGADPHVAGRMLRLGIHQAKIVGVAPDGSWGLPGNVGAWLLQSDSEVLPNRLGYVVAHLTPDGEAEMWTQCMRITVYGPNESEDDLLGVSLGAGNPGPWGVFLFTAFLALLTLPATTSVSLGEYAVCSHKPSWSRRLYRWGFLGAKIALLMPIAYLASLDLAYGCTRLDVTTAVYIQLVASFSICLFGLNWALRDQRQRCPVCLRRVVHPAQVGYASRTFLAWNGTELMCMGGHTLLHVPGLPTSWFSTQRWLYLDNSWSFLFPDSGSPIEGKLISAFPHIDLAS